MLILKYKLIKLLSSFLLVCSILHSPCKFLIYVAIVVFISPNMHKIKNKRMKNDD